MYGLIFAKNLIKFEFLGLGGPKHLNIKRFTLNTMFGVEHIIQFSLFYLFEYFLPLHFAMKSSLTNLKVSNSKI